MTIILYRMSSDSKSVTRSTSGGITCKCTVFEPCNVSNPTFLVDYQSGMAGCNYCVCEAFGRSYFCTVTIEDHRALISCKCDVLGSFYSAISGNTQHVVRSETAGITTVIDTQITVKANKLISPFQTSTPFTAGSGYIACIKGPYKLAATGAD